MGLYGDPQKRGHRSGPFVGQRYVNFHLNTEREVHREAASREALYLSAANGFGDTRPNGRSCEGACDTCTRNTSRGAFELNGGIGDAVLAFAARRHFL